MNELKEMFYILPAQINRITIVIVFMNFPEF
jgi:hypothetical protein